MRNALLCCFCLTFAIAVGAAQPDPEPAATQSKEPVFTTAIQDEAQPPEESMTCNVSYSPCYGGGSISCSGTYCSAGPFWVECDGNRTYCPPCTVSCWDTSRQCTSPIGDCEVFGSASDPFKIRCDSTTIHCP
ncbi:MAG: hypothetical protein KDD47_02530 [Acidobacteria bacterium]|nr:hypothetical protein [Acidobacteriota bacterium]